MVVSLHAQLVADGETNTLSNVTTNITGDVIVGTNGSFTLLVLSDNALLTNSANGVIGLNASAKSNEVRLVSPTARWQMGGTQLLIGSNGVANRLTILNGGNVLATLPGGFSVVGYNTGTSNNAALVADAGSRWSLNHTLFIGSGGNANTLVVSNGALVDSVNGTIGGGVSSASDNLVLVTGAGSAWSNSANLRVGDVGPGNQLIVSNGGSMFVGGSTFVGLTATFSQSNRVTVTGSGSVWSNAGDFFLGNSGPGNRLVVGNGAKLSSAANAFVGRNSAATGNSALVTDAGSSWLVTSNFFVGSNGPANSLVISNGALVSSPGGHLGGGASGSNNTVWITGAGSVWSNRNSVVFLGESGVGNSLVVSNGGRGESSTVNIGFNASANNNDATITGAGSSWDANGSLVVGVLGSGNRFTVGAGGQMRNTTATIGSLGGANNLALVTGAGSSWTNSGALTVGFSGSGNQLVVSNAGQVFAPGCIVGGSSSASGSRVVVEGGTLVSSNAPGTASLDVRLGTTVLNSGLIDVDLLLMTNTQGFFEFNGGTLVTRGAVINNGARFVVGANGAAPAIWDVRSGMSNTFIGGDFYLGSNVSSCQLILTNGAVLTNATSALLGWEAGAKSNSVTLAGAGSRWMLDDAINLGEFGSFNRLVVSNGAALVTGSSSAIGLNFSSSNNEAVVTGPGSSWTSGPGQLFVGDLGRNNRLLVSDGGQVVSYIGRIGDFVADASNNVALVTGAGSSWSNAADLFVGNAGARNSLLVSNSGAVFAGNAIYIGFTNSATNNRVIVDSGTLRVTNAAGTGLLDVRRGTVTLNTGLVDVDRLLVTNFLGDLVINGGTLSVKGSTLFGSLDLGNYVSVDPATLILAGNGTHTAPSLAVYPNGTLTGNGTINGNFLLLNGGTLRPGLSIGKIVITNSPVLIFEGTVNMEISKNGAVLTNDLVQVIGNTLPYRGSLIVTNIGPTALTAGDKFKLFSAPAYSDQFSPLSLPKPGPGLNWTNKLLVDGSIEVVPWSGPKIGDLAVSGTNLIFSVTDGVPGGAYDVLTSTNVATPLTNWAIFSSSHFDWMGNATVTNGINFAEPQRYFSVHVP